LALTSSKHKGMMEYMLKKIKKVSNQSDFFKELLERLQKAKDPKLQ